MSPRAALRRISPEVAPGERRLAGEDLAEDRAQARRRRPARRPGRPRRGPARGPCRPGVPRTDAGLRQVRVRAAPRRGDHASPRRGSLPAVASSATPPSRQDLGQAPVHHLDLAEAADHHVRRLQVAVDHAAGVGVGHRLADRLEDRQEPGQVVGRRRAGREQVGQRLPLDQLHGEVRPAVGEGAQLVDRHDARVLELAADLGLLDEPADQLGRCRGGPRSRTLTARSRPRSGSRPLRTAPMPPRAISPTMR